MNTRFVGPLNFILLQWFFIRLYYVKNVKTDKIVKWGFLKRIVPLTGWKGGPSYIKIEKRHLNNIFRTK